MEKRNYHEMLAEETDDNQIENLLRGYDLQAFQTSQYVGRGPVDVSTVLSKVIYPAYALNPQVKEKIEQCLYHMLFATDFDVYLVTLYIMSELFKEKNGIAPFQMDLSKILSQLKIELNRREARIKNGLRYPNGYTRTSAWDELVRIKDVCKEEYGFLLF